MIKLQLRITDTNGRKYDMAIPEENVESIINRIKINNGLFTRSSKDQDGRIREVAIQLSQIVSIETLSGDGEENKKRAGRQLLF